MFTLSVVVKSRHKITIPLVLVFVTWSRAKFLRWLVVLHTILIPYPKVKTKVKAS